MKVAEEQRKKQEQEREERIRDRVQKLKSRKGYKYFITNLAYPQIVKAQNKAKIIRKLQLLEAKLPRIREIIKNIKSNYVPHIWEQDAITATYLLTTKAYGNLESMILLAKEGKNFEIIELARSGHESLDLAFLFLEPRQEERLKKWFKGGFIENGVAREVLHKTLNNENSVNLPMYELKTEIYSTYSLYTHSSYGALLDVVDVFHEDYDYNGTSGFHYTLRNLDIAIENLAINILLEVKNIFTKYRNLEKINETDALLSEMGNYKATPEEIKQIFEKYR